MLLPIGGLHILSRNIIQVTKAVNNIKTFFARKNC